MRIQYASDLHLEFAENSAWLENHPLEAAGDVLVLAGDIGIFGSDDYACYVEHPFWDRFAAQYRQVVVIPGNHEFYGYVDNFKVFHKGRDLGDMVDDWRLDIRPNVRCVYNAVIPLADDIDLIATPLWSRISPHRAAKTEGSVADFYRIKAGGKRLDAARFNREHERCLAFLQGAVAASRAKHIIVATHHVPSHTLTAPEYLGSSIGGAFTVELFDYIEDSPIAYWIYGHSHRNIDDVIGKTRCVANQFGYIGYGEHLTFDPARAIEIG